MSTKNTSQPSTSRSDKRARFSEQKQARSGGASPLVLVIGVAVVLALVGGTIFFLTRPSTAVSESPSPVGSGGAAPLDSARTGSQGLLVKAATVGHDPYPLAVAENGAIQLSVSTFDDYKAHYYTYMHEGQPIEFFVLKSKDGVVRAAFNACDVCFPAKKGYTQDGDEMVCNNCGRRFPANQINEVQGGCNPSPLNRVVEGDSLIIQVDELVGGLGYF